MSARTVFESLEAEGWALLERWVTDGELESQHLEMKCAQISDGPGKLSAKTRADLAKAVSGLANAEGGVIVVGVNAQKPPDGGDDRVQDLQPVPGLPAFARAVQESVASLVEPSVPGLQVLPVPAPSDASRGVLAILVPPTDVGPFRTGRGLVFESRGKQHDVSERYYLRNGPHTAVMSHALLGLMFGRQPAPALRLVVETELLSERQTSADLLLLLQNLGRGPARGVAMELATPSDWTLSSGFGDTGNGWRQFPTSARSFRAPSVILQADASLVLHPQQFFEVIRGSAWFSAERPRFQTFRLRGTIYADGMRPAEFDEELPLVVGRQEIPITRQFTIP